MQSDDEAQQSSIVHAEGGGSREREAFLRERELREEAESRYTQMRVALDDQVSMDAYVVEEYFRLSSQGSQPSDALDSCVCVCY